eukprot:Phypoly_transcript_18828.p1 GENE.Phypoly_transcript_18828~~Phypoly_transcript_18828.p1  ORF type:complete len:120 (+),score=25.43 Phypoly_transcript_18828:310-669(+)
MSDPQFVYKILTEEQWKVLDSTGSFKGSPVDLQDGYIHLSGADTVEKTTELYYKDVDVVALVQVKYESIKADTKWEFAKARNTNFPHLFRDLTKVDLGKTFILKRSETGGKQFVFPSEY